MLVLDRLGGLSADRWICIIMHRKDYPGIKIGPADYDITKAGYLEGLKSRIKHSRVTCIFGASHMRRQQPMHTDFRKYFSMPQDFDLLRKTGVW